MKATFRNTELAKDDLNEIEAQAMLIADRVRSLRRALREREGNVGATPSPTFVTSSWAGTFQREGDSRPLKNSPELSLRVQQLLALRSKRDAEVVIGAVVEAIERTLLQNLGIEGFSLKLGSFGKLKVCHRRPATRKIGFSGKTVTTERKRKIRFVALGLLRASETAET